MGQRREMTRHWIIRAALLLLCAPATAGDVPLSWQTVPTATEYHVYSTTSTAITDATPFFTVPGTSAVVTGLVDCTAYSAAVKACAGPANCSDLSTPLVRGWPQIRIADVVLAAGGIVGVTGANFRDVAIAVTVDGVARAVSASSCTSLTFAGGAGSVVKVSVQQHDLTRTSATFVYVVAKPGKPIVIRVDAE